jgi:hypothetical protein
LPAAVQVRRNGCSLLSRREAPACFPVPHVSPKRSIQWCSRVVTVAPVPPELCHVPKRPKHLLRFLHMLHRNGWQRTTPPLLRFAGCGPPSEWLRRQPSSPLAPTRSQISRPFRSFGKFVCEPGGPRACLICRLGLLLSSCGSICLCLRRERESVCTRVPLHA